MSGRIEEIKTRLENAASSPWWVEETGDDTGWYIVNEPNIALASFLTKKDAEFIVHSKDDVNFLLDKVEKMKHALEDWMIFASVTTNEYRFLSKNLVQSTTKLLGE